MRQVPARELYSQMMRTLAQTGNGWMTFKDAANRTCNQTAEPGNVVHLSNLCTEIIEVSSDDETAVCNLGSINLAAHLTRRRRSTGSGCAPPYAPRSCSSIGSSTSTTTRARRRPRRTRAGDRSASASWACRTCSSRCGCRSTARTRWNCRPASPRRSTCPRWRSPCDLAAQAGPHPGVRRDPRRPRRSATRPVGRHADADRALGDAARQDRRARAAQLAADRDRADGHDRVDRRLLRVHRTGRVQRLQAGDAVRASSCRSTRHS